MEYEYKSIMFNGKLRPADAYNEQVQKYLDENAKDGWRLHTLNVYSSSGIVHMVFEREKTDYSLFDI